MATNTGEYTLLINAVGDLTKAIKQNKNFASSANEAAAAQDRASKAGKRHNDIVNGGVGSANNAGRAMSKLLETAGGNNSGLVAAYATLATNAFAVSAAFSALRNAAQVDQTLRGLEVQGARTGKSLKILSQDLQNLTSNSISAADAMQATAQMSAAGFSSKGMKDLTQVAYNASLALGRNVSDSLERVSKGVTKLEPELLDELGIMTKLTEAQATYALANHKSALSLSSFEKRQAFLNAVVAEGTIKFGGLSDQVNANPYDKLAATFSNLINNILGVVNAIAGPLASLFAGNQGLLLGGIVLFISTIRKQLLPAMYLMGKAAKERRDAFISEAEEAKKAATAVLEKAEADKKAAEMAKRAALKPLPLKKYRLDDLQQGTLSQKEIKEELDRLQQSIRLRKNYINAGYKDPKIAAQKEQELKDIEEEHAKLKSLYDMQVSSEGVVAKAKAEAQRKTLEYNTDKFRAAAEDKKSSAIELAATGKLSSAWSKASESVAEYRKALAEESKSKRIKDDGTEQAQSAISSLFEGAKGLKAQVSTFTSVGAAAFMRFVPYIGMATTALSIAWSAYEKFMMSDTEKARIEALRRLNEVLKTTKESIKELTRIEESSVSVGDKAAQSLIIQSNAAMGIAQAFEDLKQKASASTPEVDSLWGALKEGAAGYIKYTSGMSSTDIYGNPNALVDAAVQSYSSGWIQLGQAVGSLVGVFGLGLSRDLTMWGAKAGAAFAVSIMDTLPVGLNGIDDEAKASIIAVDQLTRILDKDFVTTLVGATDIVGDFGAGLNDLAHNPGLRESFIKVAATAYAGVADAVKALQEAFKTTGDSIAKFYESSLVKTPIDDIVKGFTSINKAFRELDSTIGGSKVGKQSQLLAGMPVELERMLSTGSTSSLNALRNQAKVVTDLQNQIKQLRDLGSERTKEETATLAQLQNQLPAALNLQKTYETNVTSIRQELIEKERTLKANQEVLRNYGAQEKLVNAISSAFSDLYNKTEAGEKARINRHNQAIKLQQAQLQVQISMLDTQIKHDEARIRELETMQQLIGLQKDYNEAQVTSLKITSDQNARLDRQRLAAANVTGIDAIDTTLAKWDAADRAAGYRTKQLAENTFQVKQSLNDQQKAAVQSYVESSRQALLVARQLEIVNEKADLTDSIKQQRAGIKNLQSEVTALGLATIGPEQAKALLENRREQVKTSINKLDKEQLTLTEDILYATQQLADIENSRDIQVLKTLRDKAKEFSQSLQNSRQAYADRKTALEAERRETAGRIADIEAQSQSKQTLLKGELAAAKENLTLLDKQLTKEKIAQDSRERLTELQMKQTILETVIGGGIENTINSLKDALNYYQKRLDLAKETQDQEMKIAQNSSKLAILQAGGTVDEKTQKDFEVEAATLAYKQALENFKLRMASIDAEYDLLDAQRTAQAENLKAQTFLLQASWKVMSGGKELPSEMQGMINNINKSVGLIERVNTDDMRNLARKQAVNDLILKGQDVLIARQERANMDKSALPKWMNDIINIGAQSKAGERSNDLLKGITDILPSKLADLNFNKEVEANKPLLDKLQEVSTNTANTVTALTGDTSASASSSSDTKQTNKRTLDEMLNQGSYNIDYKGEFGKRITDMFNEFFDRTGRTAPINVASGIRSTKRQQEIWDAGHWADAAHTKRVTKEGHPIAPPGSSLHEAPKEGAIDISSDIWKSLKQMGLIKKYGLATVENDPGHIQLGKGKPPNIVAAQPSPSVVTTTSETAAPAVVKQAEQKAPEINKQELLKDFITKISEIAPELAEALKQVFAALGGQITEETKSKTEQFFDAITKGIDVGLAMMEDLGSQMTERLGRDFGPQGKILSALGNLINKTIDFSKDLSDNFKILFPKSEVLNAANNTDTTSAATAAGTASGNAHNAVVAAAAVQNGTAEGTALGEAAKNIIETSKITIPGVPSTGGGTQPPQSAATASSITGSTASSTTTLPGSASAASSTPMSGAINSSANPEVTPLSAPSNGLADLQSKGSETEKGIGANIDNINSKIAESGQKIDEAQTKTSEGFKKQMSAASQTFGAIAGMIGAVASLLKSTSDAKIAGIDKEIAAEEKRDGKSAASVAKLDALEKKKDAQARKSFNTQKKLMLAQAVMYTAAGIASVLASPLDPISKTIFAGIIGAMGAAQIAIIASTSYESSYTPRAVTTPTNLNIGKRSDTVDLAKGPNANAGGEVGYLRGSSGTGTNASNYRTIGSAYGGELMRGYGNRGFVVGEKGPEVITPETPITVTPANDVGMAQPINANISIHALDSSGVQDILVSQKGNIIKMLREAANASGKTFMEDVNVNVYTRPSVGKL